MIHELALALYLATSRQDVPPFTVTLGAEAPAIQADRWLKGGPVRFFEKGKVYVIDSWASWCGPCRQAMPHLNELSKRYRDRATFVGISVMEWSEDEAEKAARELGPSIDYPLLRDKVPANANVMMGGDFVRNWLIKAGRYSTGIPLTFVIDGGGKIAWIGNPKELDGPLKAIMEGTWNLAEEAKKYNAAMSRAAVTEPFKVAFYEANVARDWMAMDRQVKKVLELDPVGSAGWVSKGFQGWALDAGKMPEALAFAKEVRQTHPRDAAILANLANSIYGLTPRASDEMAAVGWDCISASLALEETAFANYVMARGLLRQGRKSDAIDRLKRAIETETDKDEKERYVALLSAIGRSGLMPATETRSPSGE